MSRALFRAFVASLLLCFVASLSHAQTKTIVSGTVTDANGIPYSFGSVATQLVPTGGNPTVGGAAIDGFNNPAPLDANGHFSVSLFCNTAGGGCSPISPSGTKWLFTITNPGAQPPAGFGAVSFQLAITITGATQDVSATLSAAAPLLLRPTSGGAGLPCVTTALSLQYNNAGAFGCMLWTYTLGSNTVTAAGSAPVLYLHSTATSPLGGFANAVLLSTPENGSINVNISTSGASPAVKKPIGAFIEAIITGNSGTGSCNFQAGGVGTADCAVGVFGAAQDDPTDIVDGQDLISFEGIVGINKVAGHTVRTVANFRADGASNSLAICCPAPEHALNLYGFEVTDISRIGTSDVELAGIKIHSLTAPNAGTKFSIKADVGSGVASLGDSILLPNCATTPNSVPQFLTTTPAGGLATTVVCAPAGALGRTVAGASDTILVTDRGNEVTYSNAGAVAVTVPQAGTAGFDKNIVFKTIVTGAGGVVTFTPTTSTVNGLATWVSTRGNTCYWYSFDNANYTADCSPSALAAGTTKYLFSTPAGATQTPLSIANSLTGSQALASLSITPTWNTSGGPTAIFLNVTNSASTGAHLIDLQVGGVSQFNVLTNGTATFANAVNATSLGSSGSVFAAPGSGYQLSGDGRIRASSDGVFLFLNNAQNGFNRFQFGGNTSSFPGLCFSAVNINGCLADGTTGGTLTAGNIAAMQSCGTTSSVFRSTAIATDGAYRLWQRPVGFRHSQHGVRSPASRRPLLHRRQLFLRGHRCHDGDLQPDQMFRRHDDWCDADLLRHFRQRNVITRLTCSI